MPLGQRRVIRTKNQRQVRKLRRREAERLIQEQLPRRVGQVIFAANDVRDPHQRIVDDNSKVVRGTPIGSQEHGIWNCLGGDMDFPPHEIIDANLAVRLPHPLDPDGRRLAIGDSLLRDPRRDPAAVPEYPGCMSRGERLLPFLLELLYGTEAVVCSAFLD